MGTNTIVLANGCYRSANGKTAHGPVRGSERFAVQCLIDPESAGGDAGTLLDALRRDIPIVNNPDEALACADTAADLHRRGRHARSDAERRYTGPRSALARRQAEYADEPQIPVICPLLEGVDELVDVVRPLLAPSGSRAPSTAARPARLTRIPAGMQTRLGIL